MITIVHILTVMTIIYYYYYYYVPLLQEFRVSDSGFEVCAFMLRVQGVEFKLQGLGVLDFCEAPKMCMSARGTNPYTLGGPPTQ